MKWTNGRGCLTWEADIPNDAMYQIGLLYYQLPGSGGPIELGIQVDGQYLFNEMQDLNFPRLWKNASSVKKDVNGNEYAPEQVESPEWMTQWASDPEGMTTEPFRILLKKGKHTITITSIAEPFALQEVLLAPPDAPNPYSQVSATYKTCGYADYTGTPIIVQGEDAQVKTSKSLVSESDTTDPSLQPSDPYKSLINYIGSTNWELTGQKLVWKLNAPSSGLYQIGFHYRQSYLMNCNSYRKLRIDDKVLFSEAEAVSFGFGHGWAYQTLGDDKGHPYKVYLTKGVHELSMEVTMGPMADFNDRMQKLVLNIGDIYRNIVKVTGDTPDANRDYNLFGQIPNLNKELTADMQELNKLATEIEMISGERGGSNAVTLRNMSGVMKRMLDYSYQAQEYKSDFYNNYCSVSSLLYEMRNMPLDIDFIVLSSPDKSYLVQNGGFFKKIGFSCERFFSSFVSDYNDFSSTGGTDQKSITLWLFWGRDQVQVLNNLINDTFTPRTGIHVNIKVVNASLIQAIMSGNGPDCALALSRAQPVNLAMRGALYDLKNFPDYQTVLKRFMPGASLPYDFQNGCYALPDTQQFNVMFYRSDILKEVNLQVPKTWDQFITAATTLARYNMQVGLPYTQITDITQTDNGIGALNLYPTLLEQDGQPLYNAKQTTTELTSTKATQMFTYWTNFYTKYGLPVTYDLYSRFRTGQMPLAISAYTFYTTLDVAAPELSGRWGIAEIPGMPNGDGSIDNAEAGGGSGSVILAKSKKKALAWEFLKWWTSADIQYRDSSDLESILGVVARNATSNVEALSKMSWGSRALGTILAQWEKVQEVPEVPGGYYTPRAIDQAFWNTINNNEDSRDMIVKWSKVVDQEITRKRADYHIS